MGANAIAAHGASFAYEQDPTGAPGSFTVVAELLDLTPPPIGRNTDEATAHNDNIDWHVVGVMRRSGALSGSMNFVYDDASHDNATGIQKSIANGVLVGIRLRGPGGSADDDEIIGSGHFTNFAETLPVRDGVRTADFEFMMSGPYIRDGVTIGA